MAGGDEQGAWEVRARHRSGSLEAIVARSRRRNIAISLGVARAAGGEPGARPGRRAAPAAARAAADGVCRGGVARAADAARGHLFRGRESRRRRRRRQRPGQALRRADPDRGPAARRHGRARDGVCRHQLRRRHSRARRRGHVEGGRRGGRRAAPRCARSRRHDHVHAERRAAAGDRATSTRCGRPCRTSSATPSSTARGARTVDVSTRCRTASRRACRFASPIAGWASTPPICRTSSSRSIAAGARSTRRCAAPASA